MSPPQSRPQAAGITVPAPSGVRALAGRGVEGIVEGRRVLLGSARLMRDEGVDVAPLTAKAGRLGEEGPTVAFLADAGGAGGVRLLGLLAFGDAAKPGAAAVVALRH